MHLVIRVTKGETTEKDLQYILCFLEAAASIAEFKISNTQNLFAILGAFDSYNLNIEDDDSSYLVTYEGTQYDWVGLIKSFKSDDNLEISPQGELAPIKLWLMKEFFDKKAKVLTYLADDHQRNWYDVATKPGISLLANIQEQEFKLDLALNSSLNNVIKLLEEPNELAFKWLLNNYSAPAISIRH